eukprot:jgi/Botrbrau1/12619/Bobra.0169s0146.1
MLPQPPPSTKALFWYILRADKTGELEQVCTKLCEAPGQVMVQGVLCGSDTLQLSQALLEAAVKSLARDRRALDRDVAAYCEEAGVLGEGGRADLAIKYIGRALEASAMCYAMQRLVDAHQLRSASGAVSLSQPLKELISSRASEVIRDVASWMREYTALYEQLVQDMVYRLHNLLLLRKASVKVYDLVRLHLNPPAKQGGSPRRHMDNRTLQALRLAVKRLALQQQQQALEERREPGLRGDHPGARLRLSLPHSPGEMPPTPPSQGLGSTPHPGAEPLVAR